MFVVLQKLYLFYRFEASEVYFAVVGRVKRHLDRGIDDVLLFLPVLRKRWTTTTWGQFPQKLCRSFLHVAKSPQICTHKPFIKFEETPPPLHIFAQREKGRDKEPIHVRKNFEHRLFSWTLEDGHAGNRSSVPWNQWSILKSLKKSCKINFPEVCLVTSVSEIRNVSSLGHFNRSFVFGQNILQTIEDAVPKG